MFFLRWINKVYFISILASSAAIGKDCKRPKFGSILTVKGNSCYKTTEGKLIRKSRYYNKCDDYLINKTWNGSHFRIGPVLSSYSGNYVMSLKSSSAAVWKNFSFCIKVQHNAPHIGMKKLIVDAGDTIRLRCTFTSNCNLGAIWRKDVLKVNYLRPYEIIRINNYTKAIIYEKKNVRQNNAKIPYKCDIKDQPVVQVKLSVKATMKPDIKLSQESFYSENLPANIKLSIYGSPMPKMTCNHGMKAILNCSKYNMKEIFYREQSQPCVAQNGRYMLVSAANQTSDAIFKIRKVKLERDNGTISCSLVNSKGQQKNFTLVINVAVKPTIENISINKNNSTIDCIVRANPSPKISWRQCNRNRTICRYIKRNITGNEIGYGEYKSTISSNQTSSLNIYECKAENIHDSSTKFIDVKYPSKPSQGESDSSKTLLVIVLVCGSFVVVLMLVGVRLYWRERKRNNTYREFFMVNNNYTVDPLKTLNEQMHNLSYDKDWEFPFTFLEFKEELGCGAFGKVCKANAYGIRMLNSRDKSSYAKKQREKFKRFSTKRKHTNNNEYETTTIAVKTTRDNPNLEDIRNLAGELKMIIYVGQHENIVNLLGACTMYPKLYMIIEYCVHGSLLEFLHNKREIFQPTWIKEDFASEDRFTIVNLVMAAKQVTNGMKFLASRKCVHRDLAARNVLVAENYVMKVADFGMARDVFVSNNYISTTQGYLPVKWMALESILQKVYTEESDVWSFGILLWEMMTLGERPYPSMPVTQLVASLSEGVRMGKPASCPYQLYEIMLNCWNVNPKERASFEQLYSSIESLLYDNVIQDSPVKICSDDVENLSEELSKLIS